FTCRGLKFERFGELFVAVTDFVKQPRVLHCDDRLPLVCVFQFASKVAYLPLKVSNGWGCGRYFASLGPTRAPTLDWLLAFTTLPHLAPLGVGHDEAQSYAIREFRAMAEVRSGVNRVVLARPVTSGLPR